MRVTYDRVAIAPGLRTAIVAPVDCLSVLLEQTDVDNGLKIWDAAGEGSYKELPPGGEYKFAPGVGRKASDRAPLGAGKPAGFRAGEVICYLEANDGTGPVCVEYLA